MQYAILRHRHDDDFNILAVINNNEGLLRDEDAAAIAHEVCAQLSRDCGEVCEVRILEKGACTDLWSE